MQLGRLWEEEKRKRKPFSIKTKKIEWMRAAGRDPFGEFIKTSKCRKCGRKLIWGGKTYDFDHKNNKAWDNSQKNCYLVCLFCHRKATVIKKRKIRDTFTGEVIGYKTIRKKVGYKKSRKKKKKKKRKRRREPEGFFEIGGAWK